jgi:tetratricopeptide (TPR) repeat protein
MIVEQHPGHIPALCKLGVVDLKLNDPTAAVDSFRRAVELDVNNPYAQRMLGFSFYQLGDLPAAELNVKQAVALAPDDAKSHFLLAAITDRLSRPKEAEAEYKAAIAADPLPSEPYSMKRRTITPKRSNEVPSRIPNSNYALPQNENPSRHRTAPVAVRFLRLGQESRRDARPGSQIPEPADDRKHRLQTGRQRQLGPSK